MADDDGVTSTSDPVVTTAVSMSPTNELDLKNDIQVEEDVGQSAIQGYLGEYSTRPLTLLSRRQCQCLPQMSWTSRMTYR